MVEQPSVRRASDAKQHSESTNPLHSGISSRNVSDSRELLLPYGPLTRRSNAVERLTGTRWSLGSKIGNLVRNSHDNCRDGLGSQNSPDKMSKVPTIPTASLRN